MERAGQALLEELQTRWPDWQRRRIGVLCGGGNNGGDGYVVARRLRETGGQAEVVAATEPQRLSGEAARAAERYREAGGAVLSAEAALNHFDGFVDALLGTGLDREVTGAYRQIIRSVAASGLPVLAADIPSGLNADTGRVMGVALPAEATVTFIGAKRGLFTAEGPDYTGPVSFAALGIPASVREAVPTRGERLVADCFSLAPRPGYSHKGRFGHLDLYGGAPGTSGALVLAGRSALRAGAGSVTAHFAAEARPAMPPQAELMTAGWDQTPTGDAVAVGPGLGQGEAAATCLQGLLEGAGPLVLDADALNLVAAHPELGQRLAERRSAAVITPHPGEAGRLLGLEVAEVETDRFAAAAALAERFGAVCCLKGAGTVVATPDGAYAVSTSGNPGMAAAGQGDVLTGVVAGLLAGGYDAYTAARLAVWAHGAAGDQASRDLGPHGFLASEAADRLPAVWRDIEDDPYRSGGVGPRHNSHS
jgi:NAD(P)H-hydrate epimerase